MNSYSRLKAVIDLDAVLYNFENMRANLKEGTDMIAVIKTDAYGHGAVPIARMLEHVDYIWGYAVATFEEGMLLKKAGMKKPILCLGCIFPEHYEEMIRQEIRMTVYDDKIACKIQEVAAKLKKQAMIHVKIDTGMSRLGFPVKEESVDRIEKISKLPNLTLEGMFTHFSKSDELDKSTTYRQIQAYNKMKDALKEKGITFQYYHSSNSAALIDVPEANMNLVRAGISIYGLYPSEEVKKEAVPLKPVMQIKAHVTHVKWISAGTSISYGGTFTADKDMKVATIPMGYGDGYPRLLSNKGYVLIHGIKAPILGRVCMDQFMVDVTEIEQVEFGDEVTIVGYDHGQQITVEELSDLCGRFNYEFVCDISKRVPREYVKGHKIVEQIDYF